MKPDDTSDAVLLAHMAGCIDRIASYTSVWSIVEQDLPALASAVQRMAVHARRER
jgi:uncharacterized protein with HEPN domain